MNIFFLNTLKICSLDLFEYSLLICSLIRYYFLAFLNYYQPDCILGTESWLDKDTTTSEIFSPEYQVLRKDRNSKARGGGVFIAVRKHYDMTLLPDLETNCEILWKFRYRHQNS